MTTPKKAELEALVKELASALYDATRMDWERSPDAIREDMEALIERVEKSLGIKVGDK